MSLEVWKCFKWALNADHIPVNKDDNCRMGDYVYIGERNKYLVVRSRFHDYVTVFTHSSNNAELWEIKPKFVAEGESRGKSHFIYKAITPIGPPFWFTTLPKPLALMSYFVK